MIFVGGTEAVPAPVRVDRGIAPGLLSVTYMSAHRSLRSVAIARRLAWLLVLAFACFTAAPAELPAMPHGQQHNGRRTIDRLEERWREAMVAGDVTTLDALLADDFMGISPSGALQTKDDTVRNLKSGVIRFKSIELSDRKVRFYGSTAIVTSRAEVIGAGPSGDLSGSYRYTRIYARSPNGAWRIVSFEASRIREPGDHRQPPLH